MNLNDTPRTDAALKDVLQTGQHPKVKAEFARQLEREVNVLCQHLTDLGCFVTFFDDEVPVVREPPRSHEFRGKSL